jgi:hypothetical protein
MERSAIIEACARAAHEANRIYCEAIGDTSQVHWEDAPPWQRQSAIAGVTKALDGCTPEQQHDAWCADKRRDGWIWGAVKDAGKLTHPCLVPYADLPEAQRRKDGLYQAVVRAMAAALGASVQ